MRSSSRRSCTKRSAPIGRRRAVGPSPCPGTALVWGAQTMLLAGDSTGAGEAYEAARKEGVLTAQDELVLADLYAVRHDFPRALAHYRSAVANDPGIAAGWASM